MCVCVCYVNSFVYPTFTAEGFGTNGNWMDTSLKEGIHNN